MQASKELKCYFFFSLVCCYL